MKTTYYSESEAAMFLWDKTFPFFIPQVITGLSFLTFLIDGRGYLKLQNLNLSKSLNLEFERLKYIKIYNKIN